MEVTFLGTGTSHGVPRIGCSCPVCTSADHRNKRFRSSIHIKEGNVSVVVDTGPEFRLQALRSHITRLDAVFYTHNHADHMNGIDDLRVFSEQGPLDVYGPRQVVEDIHQRFPYAVGENPWHGGVPQLRLHTMDTKGVTIGPLHFIPVPLVHGCREVFGYRIGAFAYLSDCKEIPQSSFVLLEGVEVVVLDALRYAKHPTHMCVDEAIEAARRIGAGTTFLTHLTHRVEHNELDAYLPESMHPAYDGLVVQVRHDEDGESHG
jgi:phosphoribosyl 1,2-cyclic phosphate phosphodiesterase